MSCPFQTYGFIFGCVPIRLFLVYIAYQYFHVVLLMRLASVLFVFVSIAFFYLYFSNGRLTGPEVCNKIIWWNGLRPVHGLLYLSFSVMALLYVRYAYIPLLIDSLFGILFHVLHSTF